MQVTEIKNDLVQVRYDVNEQPLGLGDFLIVSDNNSDILSQIIILEADDNGAFCVAKFILNVNKDNSASQYSGYMPSYDASVYPVSKREIVDFITPLTDGVKLGKLLNSNYDVVLSNLILDEPLYIQSDYTPSCAKLLQFMYSNNTIDNNTVLFDCDGTFSQFNANIAVLGENVKLPLNEFFIDFIYNNDLEELTISQKALVQDILLEIKDYIKTTEKDFLEFETLINVVDGQYQDQPDDALILFRNKLIEYRQLGYFANSYDEVQTIYNAINGNMTLFSCERLAKNWQKALLTFVSSNITQKTHFIIQVTNDNIDELTVNSILNSKSISPVFISNYAFEYRNILRSKIANMIFFQAIDNLNDFPLYSNYLNILFDDSFVIWGDITSHLSILSSLNPVANVSEDVSTQLDMSVQAEQQIDSSIVEKTYENEIQNEVQAPDTNFNESAVTPQDEYSSQLVQSEKDVNQEDALNEEFVEQNDDNLEDTVFDEESNNEILENDIVSVDENSIDENIENVNEVIQENEILVNDSDVVQEQLEIIENSDESEQVLDENYVKEDIDEQDLDNLDELQSTVTQEVQENFLENQNEEVLAENEEFIVEESSEVIEDNNNIYETDVENQISENELDNIDKENLPEDYIEPNSTEDNGIAVDASEDQVINESVADSQLNENLDNEVVSNSDLVVDAYNNSDEASLGQEIVELPNEVEQVEEPKFQMPVYESDSVEEVQNEMNAGFVEGNLVFHEKYGKGIIEKVISYGAKTLCSIQFDNVGRRLLDPNLADLQHI